MTIIDESPLDPDRLEQFVFRAVDEVGATLNAALVVMGDRLGLYRALAGAGALTPSELAARTDTAERYVREWLNAQAAGGFVDYHPAEGAYSLPPEQAVAFCDEGSPAYLPGLFQDALGSVLDSPRITDAARSGAGVGWHEHNHHVHDGCERFFRPSYNANLVASWLPALDGVVKRLQQGARVADVGCGHGASTILMAQAFPESMFVGSDYHAGSIETARRRAEQAGVADRVRFEVEPAAGYSGENFDLVTMFDCLHDMGDPVGAARHVLESLASDGTWMIVEPAAGDRVEDNLNPVGRAYYGFSTLLCTPASLSQDVGLALGAEAGEARLREVVTAGGFTRFRRATETPFNLVLEARLRAPAAASSIALEPVDAVTVTTLVDNVTDSLLPDQGPAKRPSMTAAPRIATRLHIGGDTDDAVRAEHGFSALVTVENAGRETRVLFDAGRTPDGLVENMRRLGLSPDDIDIVVLSHGHWDHVTGMDGLVRRLGSASMPVLIHPEFWTRRRLAFPGRDAVELPTTSKAALRGAGFEIVEQRQPSFLLDGSLLVTGEVDRSTAFERGFPGHEAHRHGGWEPDPLILDDQALVASVRGHGLVVLTGCGHSGIINILRYVRRLTGEDRIHAVLGGFHLSGRAFEPIISATCDALGEFSPDFLVPAHCTGWRATHALAARFPEAFIQNSVGTRFEFAAAAPEESRP